MNLILGHGTLSKGGEEKCMEISHTGTHERANIHCQKGMACVNAIHIEIKSAHKAEKVRISFYHSFRLLQILSAASKSEDGTLNPFRLVITNRWAPGRVGSGLKEAPSLNRGAESSE